MNNFFIRLALFLILFSGAISVTEASQLMLKMSAGLQAGPLNDGMQIGQGIAVSHEDHSAFRIWCESGCLSYEGQSIRFILKGKQNPRNQLRVRLEPLDQQSVTIPPSMDGVIIRTSDEQIRFGVFSDGNQTIKADSYTLEVSSDTLSK